MLMNIDECTYTTWFEQLKAVENVARTPMLPYAANCLQSLY